MNQQEILTVVKRPVGEIVSIVKGLGNDVQDLLDERRNEHTTEELIELHYEEMKERKVMHSSEMNAFWRGF